MQRSKDKYAALCTREPSIPLFSQSWWLDALAGEENWDVALVESENEIVAAMPYIVRRKFGKVLLSQPSLTPKLGPWLRETAAKQANQLGRQKDLMQRLIAELPPYDHFSQSWDYRQTNWLPFYWAGFSQTTRYTYVIEPISDLDLVWDNFASSYRNKVRKAQKILFVRSDITIDDFYRVNMLTFKRQGIAEPYSLNLIKTQDSVLAERKQRRIFSAHDEEGNIHSVLYLVWDCESAYVHMVGEDPALRNSGAGILLIWEAIRYASEVLKLGRFDFAGSMIEGVERVRRDCGAKQTPYFSISKTNSKVLKAYRFLQDLRK